MKAGPKQEEGFTLIEVLAAIIILSIVSLMLSSYFTNAMAYSKANQNKTIMINLARNALFYIEKQDFDKLETFFRKDGNSVISADECKYVDDILLCSSYEKKGAVEAIVSDTGVLANVLHPTINKIPYTININYQRENHNEMLDAVDPVKKDMAGHLLPVSIVVTGAGGVKGSQKATVVEGYITDEAIR